MAQINWTRQANKDIDSIIEFLAPQSENYAKIQIQRIIDKVELLKSLPRLGRVVPELDYQNVREIIIGHYRIVYHILSAEVIDILTIHFSGRPLEIKNL